MANGSLDNTFGVGGVVSIGSGSGNSIAIQSDGNILAAGHVNSFVSVARFDSNGVLDTTFGSGGRVITDGTTSGDPVIAVQGDGKILLAVDNGLMRYLTTGSLDTAFGSGGIVTTALSGHAFVKSVAIQADNKIMVGG